MKRASALLTVLLIIVFWSLREASADPTPGYAAVQQAFLHEDFEAATSLAQSFILQHPDVPEVPRVWLWLALSLDRLERSGEGLAELDRLKARVPLTDPLWPELLFWEGEISRRASQWLRAKLAYQRLIEQYPKSSWVSQAQLGIGLIYVQQQGYDSAIGYLHEVALQRPGTQIALDALLFEGLCHLRLEHFSDAVGIFQPLLLQLKEPTVIAQTSVYLGESLSGLERYDDAARAFQRAITAAGTSSWAGLAQFGLGWALYQADRCEESVEALEWYVRQEDRPATTPRDGREHRLEALFAQGSCLIRLNRSAEASTRFEELLLRAPSHPLALQGGLLLADLYRDQGRVAAAKEILHRLLGRTRDPTTQAQIQVRLGAIALEQGNAAQAKTIFELARQSEEVPLQQAALNGLGDVQMFLGDLLGAKHWYEKAMALASQTSLANYAMFQLGRIQLLLGALDEAVHTFEQLAATSDPGLADEARLGLALAYLNRRQEDRARSLLQELRAQHPTSLIAARAAYYQALIALGDSDEALAQRLCQEVMTKAPKSEEAVDARLLLADLYGRRTSVADAMSWLEEAYRSASLPSRHRARLAKRLGDFARSQQAYTEAIRWYDEAAAQLPSQRGEIAYRVASCYEEAGDFDTAITWYQQIDQPPWRVRGQLATAKLYEREDRLGDAQAIYEALAHEPIPEAKIAQERLATLRHPASHEE